MLPMLLSILKQSLTTPNLNFGYENKTVDSSCTNFIEPISREALLRRTSTSGIPSIFIRYKVSKALLGNKMTSRNSQPQPTKVDKRKTQKTKVLICISSNES